MPTSFTSTMERINSNMKIIVERDALLAALERAKTVIEHRTSILILGHVCVQVSGAVLQLRSTDMDMEIHDTIPVMERFGSAGLDRTMVPGRVLYDIVKGMPKGARVKLEISKGQLMLRAGRSSFKMPSSFPVKDFPELGAVEADCRITIPATELLRLIEAVRYAIAADETRCYLKGVYLHSPAANMLRVVATDGYRLGMAETTLPVKANMPAVILPVKAVHVLREMLGRRATGLVEIAISKAQTVFSLNGITFTTKNVDANFPDYKRVIPKKNKIMMTADSDLLAAAISHVFKVAGLGKSGVQWVLSRNSLTVSATSPEGAEASEKIEVGYRGKPFEISLNAPHVGAMLGTILGDEVQFQMATADAPVVALDLTDPSTLHILMPMRRVGIER